MKRPWDGERVPPQRGQAAGPWAALGDGDGTGGRGGEGQERRGERRGEGRGRGGGGGACTCPTIFLICGSKPMSSMRSASSRTR